MFVCVTLCGGEYLPRLHKDVGPIDVVYTWVNGQDPEWQKMRSLAWAKKTGEEIRDVATANRFRDRDELRYSLRSLHQFAPFINHIYIVTAGQKPSWLKDDPKITIVDHKEIFLDHSFLPTFNSQAIEANLHRIPNLSERYIYFNDDFFLGNGVGEHDFYDERGKIKIMLSEWTTPTGNVVSKDNGFDAAWKVTNRFLDKLYKPKKRKALKHSPYVMLKSHMAAFENEFRPLFTKVSSHNFRSHRDYVVTNGLVQYMQLYEKRAKKGNLINRTVRFGNDFEKNRAALEQIKELKPHSFCIQDIVEEVSLENEELLKKFLQEYFPNPSPWEMG